MLSGLSSSPTCRSGSPAPREAALPPTTAEHQIVQLIADLTWRLKRVERIEQRRALAILGDLVEQPELWPEGAICTFLGALKSLAEEIDTEASVSETFTATGTTAAALATAVRNLLPALDGGVDKARTALSPETLLVDDEDRRFERHRRILEASVARQLDLLARVRALVRPAASSGLFERGPRVELHVVRC